MPAVRYSLVVLAVVLAAAAPRVETAPQPAATPLYQRFLSNPNPLELVAARKADRIAWTVYDEGRRNAYTAAAPAFTPVRLTNFIDDDGTDISQIRISDDGRVVVFCRGTVPNRDGWVANASADPDGAERAIWAVRTSGGPAWRVAEGTSPELAPDGSSVLFVKDGEIYRARITSAKPADPMDRGEKPFIRNWGVQSAPRWSPDGRKIAFVTTRQDHGFVAVYDMATRKISYMAPSVDFDANPMWTADSAHIVYTRRPGLPFGQQNQQGGGGVGIPNGPAFAPGQGRGGRGQAGAAGEAVPEAATRIPGLMRATFRGGYTLSLWKGEVATGEAEEVWHNQPNDRLITTINNPRLAGSHVVFPLAAGGGGRGGRGQQPPDREEGEEPARPVDEWDRYYSIDISRSERGAGAADDDRRPDRGPDVGRALARRRDVLLQHQCRRHRAPAHLGRAGGRRHAAAGDVGQRDRDLADAARVRRAAGDAERRVEPSAVHRRVDARIRRASRADLCVPDARRS